MRRRVAILCLVALGLSLTHTPIVAASPYPRSASGTKNCTGVGSLALISSISTHDGLKGTTTPVGSPVGGWSRTLARDLLNPDTDRAVALVSKNANARWDLATVANPAALGLPDPRAWCTLTTISGTVLKTVSGASKTCPTGQTVVIHSSGYGNEGHFWYRSGSTSQYRVKHTGGPSLKFYMTDTGARVITSYSVKAYASGFGTPDNPIPSFNLSCSGADSLSGTVSWP